MSAPAFSTVELADFAAAFGAATEVSSVALGGRALSCSDEWFAPASDLLKVHPAPSMKGQFGPAGALFDGWETRRHNPAAYDWAIVRLGPRAGAELSGFDIDTANFNGNEGPEAEVWGLCLDADEERNGAAIAEDDERWFPLLPRVPLGPSSRHLFALKSASARTTHVKLHMVPDGGIARFRCYGRISAPSAGSGEGERVCGEAPQDAALNSLDLAHVLNGGQVVHTSDQHFGVGSNLILPGRGKDMGDGWETKRSRAPGHTDHVIIRLGETGYLSTLEIDTAHFLGNFPESVAVHATLSEDVQPSSSAEWTTLLPRARMGPGKQHFFSVASEATAQVFSHVRVTMFPDGGIKRVRVVGRRAAPLAGRDAASLPVVPLPNFFEKALPAVQPAAAAAAAQAAAAHAATLGSGLVGSATSAFNSLLSSVNGTAAPGVPSKAQPQKPLAPNAPTLTLPPISASAFARYGKLIAAPAVGAENSRPHKIVNQGSARKYVALADVASSYPEATPGKASIHVYRCEATALPWHVDVLERHAHTSQAFLPMTPAQEHDGYFVVVALNGKDDKPDLSTLAAFRCSTTQGISYNAGTWHAPMKALGGSLPTDFAVVVHESGVPELDCEEEYWEQAVAVVA